MNENIQENRLNSPRCRGILFIHKAIENMIVIQTKKEINDQCLTSKESRHF